jgi:branched-chain amino acid transport system substrate-binding protein
MKLHFKPALALAMCIVGASAQADVFNVGVQLPLTGPLALAGTEMAQGIQVAADVFNRQHPKHQIKLLVIDDESTPAKAVAAVEKLASQGVVAIAGSANSNNAGPASDAANKAGLVYITSGGTSDEMVNRGLKKFFRISNTGGYAAGMVGLFSDMGVKSVSVIYSTRDATADLANKLKMALEPKGVKVTLHPFDPAISDFKPILNKVKLQDKSEAIAMVGYENDYVGILRAAKIIRPNVKAIAGPWALATPKMAASFPDLVPHVYGATVLASPANDGSPGSKDFADTFKRLFNTASTYHSQTSFVYSQLLFEAILRSHDAGTLAKGGLAEELRKTRTDNSLLGPVAFDAKGDNPNYRAHMGQFQQNGDIAIVWPKQYATEKMHFPKVSW